MYNNIFYKEFKNIKCLQESELTTNEGATKIIY